MEDLTIVISLDDPHLAEFRVSWPTWALNKQDILSFPFHVYCDAVLSVDWWRKNLAFMQPANVTVFPWSMHDAGGLGVTQREKMLAAFVFGVAKTVRTKWFAKIDVDAIAAAAGPFVCDEWLDSDPVFVSSPWGYTVPSNAIQRLDEWGDSHPAVREFPPLKIPFDPAHRTIAHRRIISWLYFGRTDWHRKAAEIFGERLPFPSHDTSCWYLAERMKESYRTIKFKRHGWSHVGGGLNKLRRVAADALAAKGITA